VPGDALPDADAEGVGDGVLLGDLLGRIEVLLGVGDALVSVGVGDAVSLGVSDGVVDRVGLGEALPSLLPTCAAVGNDSTGLPASAVFIICCQVTAGRLPP
jgi:hypothetical protein